MNDVDSPLRDKHAKYGIAERYSCKSVIATIITKSCARTDCGRVAVVDADLTLQGEMEKSGARPVGTTAGLDAERPPAAGDANRDQAPRHQVDKLGTKKDRSKPTSETKVKLQPSLKWKNLGLDQQ